MFFFATRYDIVSENECIIELFERLAKERIKNGIEWEINICTYNCGV